MNSKVKIKISLDAYDKLISLLKDSKEFSCIRLKYKPGCCGSSKIDLYVDNYKEDDILEKIDELPVLYDSEVLENILEVTLVYRNSSFMIKTMTTKELFKDCSSCTSGCGSKGSCSSGCSKKANKMA